MNRRPFAAAVIGSALLVLLTSCAASSGSAAASRSGTSPASPVQLPVLSATALPGLAASNRALPAAELAKDASLPDVLTQLSDDGYVDGRERTFQGPSRHLTFVASRTLAFADTAGSGKFLSYLRGHADAWFGGATQSQPVVSAGRSGYVFVPPMCSCHLANPVLVGVVQDGARLTWLEINGPDADQALLLNLMKPSYEEAP
jgi:hypothetical protein